MSPEDKPLRVSPCPLPEHPCKEPLPECEVKAEVEDVDEEPALGSPLTPNKALVAPSPESSCGAGLLDTQALSVGPGTTEPSRDPNFSEGPETPRADSPGRTEPCTAAVDLGGRLTPETMVEAKEEPVEVPLDVPMAMTLVEAVPEEELAQVAPSAPRPSLELVEATAATPAGEAECLSLEPQEAIPVPDGSSDTCFLEEMPPEPFLPSLEDPLAGMNALAAAAELPQARPLPSPVTGAQSVEQLEAAPSLGLEQSFLQGITLLSEIAGLELERRTQEAGGELGQWPGQALDLFLPL